ncbi:hypothetical protein FACS1894122_07830 [Alphaproteobacteria bacterium]|nr:hypothetical protein FACS1894122_07830 [Alphaproteobacteria bacterium]
MDMKETKNHVKGMLETYLRKKGIDTRKNFRCLNPDHDDKHPSMSFHGNSVHCFSCGVTYDIFSLVGIDYHISDFKKQFEIASMLLDPFSASVTLDTFSASRASQGYARCNCNAKTKFKSANSSFKGTVEASRSVVGNKTSENFQWPSESQKNGSSAMSGLTVVPRAFTPAEAVNVSSFKLAMEYLRSRGITNVTLAHGSEAPENGSNVTLAHGSEAPVNGSNVTLVTLGFGKVYGRPAIIIPTGGESYFARFIDDCTGRNKCVKHGEAKIFNLEALQTGKVDFCG